MLKTTILHSVLISCFLIEAQIKSIPIAKTIVYTCIQLCCLLSCFKILNLSSQESIYNHIYMFIHLLSNSSNNSTVNIPKDSVQSKCSKIKDIRYSFSEIIILGYFKVHRSQWTVWPLLNFHFQNNLEQMVQKRTSDCLEMNQTSFLTI